MVLVDGEVAGCLETECFAYFDVLIAMGCYVCWFDGGMFVVFEPE